MLLRVRFADGALPKTVPAIQDSGNGLHGISVELNRKRYEVNVPSPGCNGDSTAFKYTTAWRQIDSDVLMEQIERAASILAVERERVLSIVKALVACEGKRVPTRDDGEALEKCLGDMLAKLLA